MIKEIILQKIWDVNSAVEGFLYTEEAVGSKPAIPTPGPLVQVVERGANNAKVMGSTPIWTKMCLAKVSSHFTPASVQKLFKALI